MPQLCTQKLFEITRVGYVVFARISGNLPPPPSALLLHVFLFTPSSCSVVTNVEHVSRLQQTPILCASLMYDKIYHNTETPQQEGAQTRNAPGASLTILKAGEAVYTNLARGSSPLRRRVDTDHHNNNSNEGRHNNKGRTNRHVSWRPRFVPFLP